MAAAIRGPSRHSSAAIGRWRTPIVRTCCKWASCTRCRSARTARTRSPCWSRTGRSTASRPGCPAGRSPSAVTTDCCSSRAARRPSTSMARRSAGFGEAGPDEPWYDPSIFSQPGNAWGNTGRNQFRGPLTWNLDASVFRMIPFGHYHLELRVESQNVLNHPQWANPVTGFTDPNFMRIRSYGGGTQGTLARTAQGASGREVRVLRMEWAVAASATAHSFAFLLPASCFPLGIPGTIEGQRRDLTRCPAQRPAGFMRGNLTVSDAAPQDRRSVGCVCGGSRGARGGVAVRADGAGAAGRPVSPCRAGDDSAGVQ